MYKKAKSRFVWSEVDSRNRQGVLDLEYKVLDIFENPVDSKKNHSQSRPHESEVTILKGEMPCNVPQPLKLHNPDSMFLTDPKCQSTPHHKFT